MGIVDHKHCPRECEHPQPLMLANGREICGRCIFVLNVETEMVPCTPDICPDEGGGS